MSRQPVVYTLVPRRQPLISAPLVQLPVYATRLGTKEGTSDWYVHPDDMDSAIVEALIKYNPSIENVLKNPAVSKYEMQLMQLRDILVRRYGSGMPNPNPTARPPGYVLFDDGLQYV